MNQHYHRHFTYNFPTYVDILALKKMFKKKNVVQNCYSYARYDLSLPCSRYCRSRFCRKFSSIQDFAVHDFKESSILNVCSNRRRFPSRRAQNRIWLYSKFQSASVGMDFHFDDLGKFNEYLYHIKIIEIHK